MALLPKEKTKPRTELCDYTTLIYGPPKIGKTHFMSQFPDVLMMATEAGLTSLARDLVDQKESFQDFVIVHELLHLRVPTHGRLFSALMTAHVPGWRRLELARRDVPVQSRPPLAQHGAEGERHSGISVVPKHEENT